MGDCACTDKKYNEVGYGSDVNNVKIGDQFQVENQSGQPLVITAIKIKDETIVLDGNHPLVIAIQIVAINCKKF